jgi:hypothetical protein
VGALASQARHFGSGLFSGDPDDHMAQRQRQFADQVAAFPDEVVLKISRSPPEVLVIESPHSIQRLRNGTIRKPIPQMARKPYRRVGVLNRLSQSGHQVSL